MFYNSNFYIFLYRNLLGWYLHSVLAFHRSILAMYSSLLSYRKPAVPGLSSLFFFLLLLYLAGEYLIHMSNSYKTYQKYRIVLNLSTLQTLICVPGAKHQTHRLIGLEPVTNVTKDHPVITPDICSHQTHSQGQQQPDHSPYSSDNSPRQHWSPWNCPKFALVEVKLQTSSLNW